MIQFSVALLNAFGDFLMTTPMFYLFSIFCLVAVVKVFRVFMP